MIRIKVIKPKKSIMEQAMEAEQKISCPACKSKVKVPLKTLLQKEFTCPKCKVKIPIKHRQRSSG